MSACRDQVTTATSLTDVLALLHGTRAVGVSQTLRRGTRNGITELSHTVPSTWQGGHHVGHRPTFLVYISFVLFRNECFWEKCHSEK